MNKGMNKQNIWNKIDRYVLSMYLSVSLLFDYVFYAL